MRPSASVQGRIWPPGARSFGWTAGLTGLAAVVILLLASSASASSLPGPDPSPLAPDPAPSSGQASQAAAQGPSAASAPASTGGAAATPTTSVARHHTAAQPSKPRKHRGTPTSSSRHPHSKRHQSDRPTTKGFSAAFVAKLRPAFDLPGSAAATANGHSDALGLAAIALLLLVVTGVLVVRTSAELLERGRAA
jgi:hypothetical protein